MTLELSGPPGSPSCHHLTAGDPEVRVPSQGARGLPAARGQRAEAPARGVPRLSSSAPHTCLFFSNRQFCPLSHTPVLAWAKGPRCGAQGPAADRPPWIGCGCETGTAPSASRGQARDAGRGTPPRPTWTALRVCWSRRDLRVSCDHTAAMLSPSPGGRHCPAVFLPAHDAVAPRCPPGPDGGGCRSRHVHTCPGPRPEATMVSSLRCHGAPPVVIYGHLLLVDQGAIRSLNYWPGSLSVTP